MARNIVQDVGTAGIIRDVKPQLLGSQFWTNGRNVRFHKNKVYAMGGAVGLLPSPVTGLLNVGIATSATVKYLLYTTGTDVFSFDGTTSTEITRTVGGDYSETIDDLFQIQMYNGLAILNNGIDLPQQWGFTGKLTDLSNWNVSWTTKSLRPFKSLLIAMYMEEGVNVYPHRLRWSHPADPGAVPSTWDETNASFDAGLIDFADTDKGFLVDGMELGDRFYVYKEGSIWVLSYRGGRTTFVRNNIVNNVGLHVKRSLIEIPGSRQGVRYHFFAADNNFYVMDGQKVTPVFEDIFKNEIYKVVDEFSDNYRNRSFSVLNAKHNEIWFCVPEKGYDYPNVAFCMNYHNNTFSIRDLSGASNIVSGVSYSVSAGNVVEPLAFSDGSLFSDDTGFLNTEVTASEISIIEASPVLDDLFLLDRGTLDYDETPFESYIERTSLPTVKNDPRNPSAEIQDYFHRKLVTAVVPKLYAGTVNVTLGTQETDTQSVSWGDPIEFDTSVYRLDLEYPVSGRFISFRFSSVAGELFELGGFDYELNILGEF